MGPTRGQGPEQRYREGITPHLGAYVQRFGVHARSMVRPRGRSAPFAATETKPTNLGREQADG
jgi:hypothetical protein